MLPYLRHRSLPALSLLALATLCFLGAYDGVPDPEPGLNQYAFTLLFGAVFACTFGGVAALIAAAVVLFSPRPE